MKTNQSRPLDSITDALNDLKAGKMIIVVDNENRENEGDFVMAAEMITPEAINFMASVGKGLICTPLSADLAKKFELPLQASSNTASLGTAFTVSIDAKEKISTGISASDRAHTIKMLTEQTTQASDFVRPGHIFPLIAKTGGVLERPGHTEASVDLCELAGLSPVGVICEIMNPDGSMARFAELCDLADKYQLKMISIDHLINYRQTHQDLISSVESIPFPNKYGDFQLYIFRSAILKQEHQALVKGDLTLLKNDNPLVRIHSECFTGDIFGSLRCDCGEQLESSMQMINDASSGMVIYLRQEGRGIGLFDKIKAYQLQDQGMDTLEANLHLGHPVDLRDYTMAAQILRYFGVNTFKLLTNNPLKIEGLKKLGCNNFTRLPLEIKAQKRNAHYLLTKKEKLGHLLKQESTYEN
jgi:3,4-dihydroxy 2-butanone 4-phosphate synthase/GTP cyclohydrolase II